MAQAKSSEKVVQEIRRKTRRRFSAEEKIRIVLDGLRGEESIATLCRRQLMDDWAAYLSGPHDPGAGRPAQPLADRDALARHVGVHRSRSFWPIRA